VSDSDHQTPFVNTDEKHMLLVFLDYLRDAIVRKASGLDDDALRRSVVPSGTSLLGLVKHLTFVEVAWLQWSFAGLDVIVPQPELEPGDTTTGVLTAYRDATRQNNAVVEACEDLEQRCARTPPDKEPLSLRWVLVHMVEETGRHAGHADVIREQIDGATGR
jgi:uncharacterized damage-inducible protein DinB